MSTFKQHIWLKTEETGSGMWIEVGCGKILLHKYFTESGSIKTHDLKLGEVVEEITSLQANRYIDEYGVKSVDFNIREN